MKINAGKYKYRNIALPQNIRPTTEKVREAIMSMVGPWIEGAAVLDLFAGSGALGLEALSRGAEFCYFCESNRANCRVLESNIENCKAGEESKVYNNDFKSAIAKIGGEGVTLDLVFLDPPYEQTDYYETAISLMQEYQVVDEGTLVVAEHLYDNKLSDKYGNFIRIKDKKYGSIGVDVYIYENPSEGVQ